MRNLDYVFMIQKDIKLPKVAATYVLSTSLYAWHVHGICFPKFPLFFLLCRLARSAASVYIAFSVMQSRS